MNIDRVKFNKAVYNVKLTIAIVLILNAILTAVVLRYAGVEVLWTMSHKGLVNREIVRVNKLAIEGRVLSPIPLE